MSNNSGLDCIGVSVARRSLSRLLAEVEAGGEVVISRRGKPVARLVSAGSKARAKRLGLLKGQIVIPDDFDTPLSPESLLGG